MTTLEALKAARELIAVPKMAMACMVVRAIDKATGADGPYAKCIEIMLDADEPNPTTVAEVLALFDKAIARLEAGE